MVRDTRTTRVEENFHAESEAVRTALGDLWSMQVLRSLFIRFPFRVVDAHRASPAIEVSEIPSDVVIAPGPRCVQLLSMMTPTDIPSKVLLIESDILAAPELYEGYEQSDPDEVIDRIETIVSESSLVYDDRTERRFAVADTTVSPRDSLPFGYSGPVVMNAFRYYERSLLSAVCQRMISDLIRPNFSRVGFYAYEIPLSMCIDLARRMTYGMLSFDLGQRKRVKRISSLRLPRRFHNIRITPTSASASDRETVDSIFRLDEIIDLWLAIVASEMADDAKEAVREDDIVRAGGIPGVIRTLQLIDETTNVREVTQAFLRGIPASDLLRGIDAA